MSFADVITIISIFFTVFSFGSEQQKKLLPLFWMKVKIFKLVHIYAIVLFVVLLKITALGLDYFKPTSSNFFISVLLKPQIYEYAFVVLFVLSYFYILKIIITQKDYPSKSIRQRLDFIEQCIDKQFDFNWFKTYVNESIVDLIKIARGPNCNQKNQSKRIITRLFDTYINEVEKDDNFVYDVINHIYSSYTNGCQEKYDCVEKIVERSFLNPNSVLWKDMALAQDLSKNNLARFLLSYEAFSKKQDIICLLHRHHNEFNTENIDSYINFMKYFIQLFFSDKIFQSRCFLENNLKFYFEQYNDIMTDSLKVTYKKIWDIYADFVSRALNDLYFDYSFVHDIIMRYYFEYIEKLYMIYPHKEDLGFEMRSRRMYKTLIENWYYSHTQEIFNHIKKKIENFCLNNIHYLRWFFICEKLGNSPYSFVASIWKVIQENFPRWYDENPDMATFSLPAWVSYDCDRKVLERHPLVENRRKVIDAFQCI